TNSCSKRRCPITSLDVRPGARDETPKGVAPSLPYRGIQPYRYSDHGIFFARDEEANDLLRLVVVYRAVMLYGESGSGKSSLVNAALMDAAQAKGFQPERVRVQPTEDQEFVVERIAVDDAATSFLPSVFAGVNDTEQHTVLSADVFVERLRAGCASA